MLERCRVWTWPPGKGFRRCVRENAHARDCCFEEQQRMVSELLRLRAFYLQGAAMHARRGDWVSSGDALLQAHTCAGAAAGLVLAWVIGAEPEAA